MLAISQVVNGKHFHKSTVNLPVSEEWVQQLHKIQLQLTILTKQRGVKNVQKSNSSNKHIRQFDIFTWYCRFGTATSTQKRFIMTKAETHAPCKQNTASIFEHKFYFKKFNFLKTSRVIPDI